MNRSAFSFAKTFFLGSGREPDVRPFEDAVKDLKETGATPRKVHWAWRLWKQYLKDSLWAMPLHRRMLAFMPYSYRDSLLGWMAFLAENDLLYIDESGMLAVKISEEG